MKQGVVYVASGAEFVEEAVDSAKSVEEYDIDTAIITSPDHYDLADEEGTFDRIITKEFHGDIRDKVYNIKHTPFDKTVFLDTDTIVLGNIKPLFELLDRVDIACARAQTTIVSVTGVPDSFPEFNTGVIAFNNNTSLQAFFRDFEKNYERQIENRYPNQNIFIGGSDVRTMDDIAPDLYLNDQPAFRKTLYESNITFSVLPKEYNFAGDGSNAFKKVKIIHSRELIDNERFKDEINKHLRFRSWREDTIYRRHHPDVEISSGAPVENRVLQFIVSSLPIGVLLRRLGVYESSMNALRRITER